MTYFVAVGPLVLVLLSIELGQSAPLFVNECVHIKGHVLKLAVRTSPRHNYMRGLGGHGPHAPGWHNPDQDNQLRWRSRPLMVTRPPVLRGRHQLRRPQNEWVDRMLALDAIKRLTRSKKKAHSYSQAAFQTASQNMLKFHNKNASFHCDALHFHAHHFKAPTQESNMAQEYLSNRQSEDHHNDRRGLRAKRVNSKVAQFSAHDHYQHGDEHQLGAHDGGYEESAFVPDAVTHAHRDDGMTQTDEEFALPNHEHGYPPFNDNAFKTSYRDWPEVENSRAAETYTGIDSYSADHVQGLDSGVYQYPIPFL